MPLPPAALLLYFRAVAAFAAFFHFRQLQTAIFRAAISLSDAELEVRRLLSVVTQPLCRDDCLFGCR